MDTVIEVHKRSDDYHAQVFEHPEIWGCGVTSKDAIGDMISSHAEYFKLQVVEASFNLSGGK